MAVKYVSRCFVIRNGTKLEHIKNYKSGEQVYRNEVDLMSGSGSVDIAGKYKFSFDYAIPKVNPKTDWSDVEDDTFIIEYEGGHRVTYSGVDCLSVGEATIDGQSEAVMTISFIAKSRDEG
jgi:hypothetical protein